MCIRDRNWKEENDNFKTILDNYQKKKLSYNKSVDNSFNELQKFIKIFQNAEDFSKFLLTDFSDQGQTLMLAPGQGFYSTPGLGKNEVRIAFVLETEKLIRAAQILEKALEIYNQ